MIDDVVNVAALLSGCTLVFEVFTSVAAGMDNGAAVLEGEMVTVGFGKVTGPEQAAKATTTKNRIIATVIFLFRCAMEVSSYLGGYPVISLICSYSGLNLPYICR